MHKHTGSPLAYDPSEGHVHTAEQPQINRTPLCTHSSERSTCVCKLSPNNSEQHIWRSHAHTHTHAYNHKDTHIWPTEKAPHTHTHARKHCSLNIKLASPKLSRSCVCVCVCMGVSSRAELDKCASNQQGSIYWYLQQPGKVNHARPQTWSAERFSRSFLHHPSL